MSQAMDLPQGVHIVAQSSYLSGVEAIKDDITAVECDIADPLPLAKIAGASIVVIEVDPTSHNSIERVDRLKNELPNVPIIAGLAKVDIATSRQMLRRGVSDIVALPFTIDELVTALVDTAARISPEEKVELAPLIAVMKTLGGSGATTVATHLAAELASGLEGGGRACVIDLDLQAGDVSSYLGCAPKLTLTDLLEAGERLDEELIQSVACEGHRNVDVIAAPAEIVPIESIDFDELVRVITHARRRYDYVLIDLPATLTNWSLSSIFAADLTVMVGTLTVPSLRHAKRQLNFLMSMGIARDTIHVVLNRIEKKLFKAISTSDAEEALKHPVLAQISEETTLLRTAQDQGQLIEEVQKRSRFRKDIVNLADLLSDRLMEVQ
ncbi:pilus assembly protein CpaE [Altererythrobacter xiamenensis]|uniref:Pilus assembly protein CpaE n=2 Tax=Altererythrobacter xiamenensis TaxID=1316679 RepID=A0A1Y6E821_9SPHN|nr:pilus assembly protein CpaE [Altererythrobacter xiamenensis]